MSNPLEYTNEAKQQRITRTRSQWQTLVDEYAISELTVGQFCQHQGLTPSAFYLWRKRLSNDEPSARVFASIEPPLAIAESWDVELELGSGMVLRLRRA